MFKVRKISGTRRKYLDVRTGYFAALFLFILILSALGKFLFEASMFLNHGVQKKAYVIEFIRQSGSVGTVRTYHYLFQIDGVRIEAKLKGKRLYPGQTVSILILPSSSGKVVLGDEKSGFLDILSAVIGNIGVTIFVSIFAPVAIWATIKEISLGFPVRE